MSAPRQALAIALLLSGVSAGHLDGASGAALNPSYDRELCRRINVGGTKAGVEASFEKAVEGTGFEPMDRTGRRRHRKDLFFYRGLDKPPFRRQRSERGTSLPAASR